MAVPLPPPLPVIKHSLVKNRSRFQDVCTVSLLDRMFDDGYRADVSIRTDNDGLVLAHANVLGMSSPVLRAMLQNIRPSHGRRRGGHRIISIPGVPHESVRVFIRYLYSSCYEPGELKENAIQLLVLSHKYVVPRLKRLCERELEIGETINVENVIDFLQLALLCDAPRLSLMCHRFVTRNLKAVLVTDGWIAMKESHPILETQLMQSIRHDENMHAEIKRRKDERKVYIELYEAMEALVHICKGGVQNKSENESCKVIESLVKHFACCKRRVGGGCDRCKKMWQLLELHSHLCAESNTNTCRVPLCKNFKQRRVLWDPKKRKDEIKWRILVRKIIRTKSITGAPFFQYV